ncbi:Protein ALP1-like [Holothuria leucospilota]|uniref:Protein ALP1-like n=1 Tax=Holothuria leucospilota TaxID=206669 RepID=A0A9Q1HHM5_HOLLE|nr:Protein ALP1-like [Holothuria leucospilota]
MTALLRIQERNPIRRERIFRDRLDPLAVPEEYLIRKYRLPRAEIINLIELSGEDLERATNRSPVAVQVVTSLRFFASDSGYPSKPWLLTPLRNPVSPEEFRYNNSHRTARCIAERCIGVLKSRFRYLHSSGGSLQYDQIKCCKIIVAAVILHNICILRKVPFLDDISVNDPDDNQEGGAQHHDGVAG